MLPMHSTTIAPHSPIYSAITDLPELTRWAVSRTTCSDEAFSRSWTWVAQRLVAAFQHFERATEDFAQPAPDHSELRFGYANLYGAYVIAAELPDAAGDELDHLRYYVERAGRLFADDPALPKLAA